MERNGSMKEAALSLVSGVSRPHGKCYRVSDEDSVDVESRRLLGQSLSLLISLFLCLCSGDSKWRQ